MDRKERAMNRVSRRKVIQLGAASTALLATGPRWAGRVAAQATPATGAPITVGLLAPVTGVFADFGDLMTKATNLAVQKVNTEGGILGRALTVVAEDDQGDPAVATERARKLLTQDNVDILMGTVSSATTLAVLPLVDQAKKVFFYPLDGEDKTCLAGGGTNPLVFGLGDTPQQRLSKFVPTIVEKAGKDWYFIGNDYVFPRSVNAVAIQYLKGAGGNVVAEEYVPLGTSDYRPVIDKIANSGAKVVFSTTVGTDGVAFTKQAREGGLFDRMTVTGVATFAPEVYGGLKGFAEGVLTADRYAEAVDNAVNKEFVASFRDTYDYNLPIGGTAAACYGAVLLWREAAKKANSFDPEPFAKACEGLAMTLPQGDVEIDATNHLLKQHIYLLRIENDAYQIDQDFGQIAHPDHEGCSVV
jgi:ABC-type branched-subunit amino acid transport system substrate-binding protein